jgi:uncharacterized surface anchored protein
MLVILMKHLSGNFVVNQTKKQAMRNKLFFSAAIMVSLLLPGKAMASDTENKEKNLVSVTGQVIDKNTGEALAGVLLRIEESGSTLYTDFEGGFEITDIYPGTYNINVSFISYQSEKVKLDLNGDDPVRISLNQASLR